MYYSDKLFLNRSANRASACTRAARNALICVDHVLAVSFGNAADGALSLACAACNALIGDFESHDSYLHYVLQLPL